MKKFALSFCLYVVFFGVAMMASGFISMNLIPLEVQQGFATHAEAAVAQRGAELMLWSGLGIVFVAGVSWALIRPLPPERRRHAVRT